MLQIASPPLHKIRRFVAPLLAMIFIASSGWMSQEKAVSPEEAKEMAGRFSFERIELPLLPGTKNLLQIQEVHPDLARIESWISSLGSSVSLADLGGDGVPDYYCRVEPRTNQVIIGPVPGTKANKPAFALDPSPLPYDPNRSAPMGALIGDFNEDGLLDVLVYYWGRSPVLFLRRSVDLSRDAFVPQELVAGDERWFTNCALQADFDGDGHVDFLVANYFNDGDAILDARPNPDRGSRTSGPQMHAGKANAHNGGQKHLFLWKGGQGGANPWVTYTEALNVIPESISREWTLAVAAADLDGDLFPELYLAQDFGPDQLLHNRTRNGKLAFVELKGKRDFFTPKSCVLGNDSFKGMGAEFGDATGNGLLDIYVSNIATPFGLMESHFLWLNTGRLNDIRAGIAPFVHGAEKLGLARSGWGWDCRLADFDNGGRVQAVQAVGFIKGKVKNSGWAALQALGTSNSELVSAPKWWPNFRRGVDLSGRDINAFFVRAKDGRFYDLNAFLLKHPDLGSPVFTEPMVSRGIAIGDVNGDGRLDFALANQWEPSFIYLNRSETASTNAFLGLHLLIPRSADAPTEGVLTDGHPHGLLASPAIGAVAHVTLPDGRKLISQIDGGNGHSGHRPPSDIHFGLGALDAGAKVRVDIDWRDALGRVEHSSQELLPGWHTVLLGTQPEKNTAQTTASN